MPRKSIAANIVAGVRASLAIEPEFMDANGIHAKFGIKRGLAWTLMDQGVIEGVSLRRRGAARGKRLFDVASIRRFIAQQTQEQKKP